jgi:hypothetical protein
MNNVHKGDVAHLDRLYKSIFRWQDVQSAPQPSRAKRLNIDGAGIFWREHATIYRMQYGGFECMTLPRENTAKLLMKFIEEHFT